MCMYACVLHKSMLINQLLYTLCTNNRLVGVFWSLSSDTKHGCQTPNNHSDKIINRKMQENVDCRLEAELYSNTRECTGKHTRLVQYTVYSVIHLRTDSS